MFEHRRPNHLLGRVAAVAVLLLSPFAVAACGGDDGTAGPETGADVEDITEDDYFADDQYVGEEVTVSANVTEVIDPQSFVLAGEDYGDDSLLVLSGKDARKVQEGDVVKVTGTVREFDYENYRADYALGAADLYTPYDTEEFLVADSVTRNTASTTATR
ncbi:hypothetical protein [Qaidamihabitans albus]|uniref:hypothetical protein n=1 Tax=Qaidamihabitans albus TaxID=2795733 RepID=UPI0018F1422B|nr:hypothetical protein [Qaidamihabitans albus]